MVLFTIKFKNYFYKIIFFSSSFMLLFYIDSRNIVLFYINFVLFTLIYKYLGIKYLYAFLISLYIIIIPIISIFYFNFIDKISSYRLTRWINNFEFSFFGKENNLEKIFHIKNLDNFYVEFAVNAGIIPLFILLLILFYLGWKLKDIHINNFPIISLYLSFLILCALDSGMFSTGNILHVVLWSFFIFAIKNKNYYLNNVR